MKRLVLAALSVFVTLACGPEAREPRPPLVASSEQVAPVPPPPAPREDGRLPTVAKPLRYALRLAIDPRKDTFSGSEDILLDVGEPTAHVVLNARDAVVKRASIKARNETLPLHATMRASRGALAPDELVLSADRLVPSGHATVTIEWEAPFGKELAGLYVAKDAGDTYAFTQFEAADARRAFPCFDEPGYKTPFDVTLTVPSGMLALSNGPEAARDDKSGATTFTFKTTAPIPTYLVAFAVGNFDLVEGQKSNPPIRFVTTHGRGAFAKTALHDAEGIVPLLAKYFGIAYPYDKLDLVAVPDFGAGGMENAGIITFRDDAVLLDENASLRQKRGLVGLMTHELAHQWFGDLVTMKWWDDLWLNEGFATWTTYKIVDAYAPELGSKIDAAASATYIMDQDGLASARAIRQPVASVGQAMESFDGITYQKGAAVLRMIEHYVGDDAFQRGVHAYLAAHAFGNATADDLLSAVDAASPDKSASDLARAYLDQPGVPVVALDGELCGTKATLMTKVARFAPLGTGSVGASASWKVPFCAEPGGANATPTCALLEGGPKVVSVPSACPVFANPDAMGYYRAFWPTGSIGPLFSKLSTTSPGTRVAALADAWAEVRSGKLDAGVLLREVLPAIDREDERHVVERLTSILFDLADVVDAATWPAFEAYAHARIAPHLARLDRARKLDDDQKLLRSSLSYADVALGVNEALAKKLAVVAKKFASGDASIDVDYGQIATEIGARFETPATLQQAVTSATTPQAHALALRAASGVTTPEGARAQLEWMLSPAVKLQDVRYILWPLASHRATRATTLAWVHEHWDALRGKLPGQLSRGLVGMSSYACTPTDLDEARAFYTQKAATLEGAARPLAQSLETASLCVALRTQILPEMRAALPRVSSSATAGPARR
ncbi:MAG TPA: M1 family metallopeptidase [Polyangiaceae bacterium]|jgi:alanyl aminopeptidase